MHPDWLGSPQHFVAGILVGFVAATIARRWTEDWWVVAMLAIGATATAELLVEVIEYPLLYGDGASPTAYYDTIADLVATLAGGVVGTAAALFALRRRADAR